MARNLGIAHCIYIYIEKEWGSVSVEEKKFEQNRSFLATHMQNVHQQLADIWHIQKLLI